MPVRWIVYLIENHADAYIGMTRCPRHRLLQHNSKKTGGALKTTRKSCCWSYRCIVHGFKTKLDAWRFEHAWRMAANKTIFKTIDIDMCISALETTLMMTKWTKHASRAIETDIAIQWFRSPVRRSHAPHAVHFRSKRLFKE